MYTIITSHLHSSIHPSFIACFITDIFIHLPSIYYRWLYLNKWSSPSNAFIRGHRICAALVNILRPHGLIPVSHPLCSIAFASHLSTHPAFIEIPQHSSKSPSIHRPHPAFIASIQHSSHPSSIHRNHPAFIESILHSSKSSSIYRNHPAFIASIQHSSKSSSIHCHWWFIIKCVKNALHSSNSQQWALCLAATKNNHLLVDHLALSIMHVDKPFANRVPARS